MAASQVKRTTVEPAVGAVSRGPPTDRIKCERVLAFIFLDASSSASCGMFLKRWVEAFATDSNVLASTAIPLGSAKAAKVRVIMHEVNPPHFFMFSRIRKLMWYSNFRARPTQSTACLRVTLFSALQTFRFSRRACRQLLKIVLRQRRAKTLVTNTFRLTSGIMAHAQAKPFAVNSHRWR